MRVFHSTYYFSVNDFFENDSIKRSEKYQLDRFNKNTFGEDANKASVLNIGMEVQYSSRFPSDHYPSGKIETYSFHSTILNDTRKIYIYTPHDYSHTSHLQELLIVFDRKIITLITFNRKNTQLFNIQKKSHLVLLLQ